MQGVAAYKQVEIGTSGNVRIISLLYEGAINFIRLGKEKIEAGDIAGKGLYIGKATAIVGELTSSLNMEAGGKIARNLGRLYDFVLDRLLRGNIKNDLNALESAEKVLKILKEGWEQIESTNVPDKHNQRGNGFSQEIRV